MDRPTIFLSSTIYDFSDLRSALKDYLEDRGCRVLASEYTDFTRPLDTHSYEAWSCPAYVPVSQLIYAAFRSKAKGLLPPSDE
jgi:hypothetical protein